MSFFVGALNFHRSLARFVRTRVPNRCRDLSISFCTVLLLSMVPTEWAASEEDDLDIALSLANALRAARTVIADNQALINDPLVADKDLSGANVVRDTLVLVNKDADPDPLPIDADTKYGRLLQALLDSIKEVMDENQRDINTPDVGFKGFVPAVFARLVNERFSEKVGQEAEMKVTAPTNLVRNRKARPDEWERNVIDTKFDTSDWQRGELFSEVTTSDQRPAFRVMVPEYYGKACLACHGNPKDEIDITGYPKEGGKLGDLGGAISITLFR